MIVWITVTCAAGAAALAVPLSARLPLRTTGAENRPERGGWMLRFRMLWAVLSAIGAASFVGGPVGIGAGAGAAVGTWLFIGRAEPPEVRRRRESVRRDLPHVVSLFATALRSGAAPRDAVIVVCAALPGAAADRLSGVAARLSLGVDPVQVWESLGHDRELARLGRTMARAQATGSPVVGSVERLAEDLARRARSEVEERARAVGVKAALPLGLCLLPAFILVGIVPVVAGLLSTLAP